jgi:hypothetical protein
VPASALEKYKAAAPWKNFMNIVAIDGTNDISDIKFIPSDQQGAAIYSIDGRSLPTPSFSNGELRLSRATLGTGIFIVKVGTFSTKIQL